MCKINLGIESQQAVDIKLTFERFGYYSLIIGAGPSGLVTAYWMARYGIRARIIDKRETKVFTGHADGIRMRTLEIFDSMGIHHRVDHEGHPAVEPGFWVRQIYNGVRSTTEVD